MNQQTPTLQDRLLAQVQRNPGMTARQLAEVLGAERREVNQCLAYALAGQVQQGSDYRWRPVESAQPAVGSSPARATTELARLCRYYLECIGQDMDEGASTFASSKYGEPEYAELPSLPVVHSVGDWFNAPGVGRVLAKVRQERGRLVAWLGYPVRLRRHRTPRWEGFFVEPVLMWRIELGEQRDEPPRIDDEAPVPNTRFMRSVAMGDALHLAEETARLTDELGLNVTVAELPEPDEIIERLMRIRPDWDWQQALDPTDCRGRTPLAEITEQGIYNRAVVLPVERSPFTQGLETELNALGGVAEAAMRYTALGQWLSAGRLSADEVSAAVVAAGDRQPDPEPLIEVLPMNTEQRAAVRMALSAPHSVITGPPGTGKSQVVTNLLVNAAWRGMKVLFASKNNKAVDVVEARFNGLGNRPVLLRLGSKEYQAKLAGYLTRVLAGNPSVEDKQSYEEGLDHHRSLTRRLAELDHTQQLTLDARNNVDRLDLEAEHARDLFSVQLNAIDEQRVRQGTGDLATLVQAVDRAHRAQNGLLMRLLWALVLPGRLRDLNAVVTRVTASAAGLGVLLPNAVSEPDLPEFKNAALEWNRRLQAARKVLAYRHALDVLKGSPSFEDIARQRTVLAEQLAQNSQRLWGSWVQLAPARLTPAQRKDVADYAAALPLITGPDARRVHTSVRQHARVLQTKMSELFACWAVTSLSARGRVPFEPGYFDLVIIDEASQCDIASALPLLYRARRSVIIGDPQQLRHISAVSKPRDSELQYKHGLVDTRLGWMYSVSSLFDVAAGVVPQQCIVNLHDHHRSHADIIEFSNQTFYEGRLRVATRYQQLKRPRNTEPGVLWEDVQGAVTRPTTGGALNVMEARAVIAALEDLLIKRAYNGTVGVVTPFRAQAQLLKQLVAASAALVSVQERCALLVDTVHSFQGDERDVMFFSPVVSNDTPPGALGFLRSNGNLFNVAITRARGLLHVVGDQTAALSSGVDYLANFAGYVAQLNAPQVGRRDAAIPGSLGEHYPETARPETVSVWERVLYRALFAAGVRPTPQYPVEQYDLDFAVIVGERMLNIEVDGERYHRDWTGELCLRDQLRNQRLIELGWDVKRFWVYEVRDRLDECVEFVVGWVDRAKGIGLP